MYIYKRTEVGVSSLLGSRLIFSVTRIQELSRKAKRVKQKQVFQGLISLSSQEDVLSEWNLGSRDAGIWDNSN